MEWNEEYYMIALFWLSLVVVMYTWIGYPLLLRVANVFQRNGHYGLEEGRMPMVTLLVAAHNEQETIGTKIENSLALEYPRSKLEIVVASDGSTDQTDEIVQRYVNDGVKLLRVNPRQGKTMAQNAAIETAKGEIIFFTDANTMLDSNCLMQVIRRFSDPKVGCVAAQMVWTNQTESGTANSGSFYWKLEKMLWEYESRLGIMAWAPGGAMAIRASLIRLMDGRYGEDCIIPLDVVSQGYRVVYEPAAVAYDTWAETPISELRARQRMTLRSFSGTLSKYSTWHPLRRPKIAWAVISHKIMRWLTPYFLLIALCLNLLLLYDPFYRLTFAIKVLFLLSAIIGYVADRRSLKIPLVAGAYSFSIAILGMLIGVTRALLGYRILAYRSEG